MLLFAFIYLPELPTLPGNVVILGKIKTAKMDKIITKIAEELKDSKKEDVINHVLSQTGFKPEQVLMVGDRSFDLEGAAEFGMDAVGVLYGFGSREELSSYKNIALIENIGELINVL